MSLLDTWYPGDSVIGLSLVVAAAVFVVSTMALLAGFALKSRPAARHVLSLTALICCLLSPIFASVSARCGLTLVQLPLLAREEPNAVPLMETGLTNVDVPRAPIASSDSAANGEGDLTPSLPAPEIRSKRNWQHTKSVGASDAWAAKQSVKTPAAIPTRPSVSRLRRCATAVLFGWAAGFIMVLVAIVRSCWRLERVRNSVRLTREGDPHDLLGDIGRQMKMRRLPMLGVSSEIFTPMAIGWVRPVIALPQSVLSHVTHDQLRDILVHEAAHILRRDQYVVALQLVGRAVFWPIATIHWLNRQLMCAREEVCDNFVLDNRDAACYGETLLRLAQLAQGRRPLAAATGILHWRGALETRIAGMLRPARNRQKKAGVLLGAAFLMLFAFASAALCGTTFVAAQESTPKTPAVVIETAQTPAAEPQSAKSNSGETKTPVLKPRHRPFDGSMFFETITGAEQQPVFIDLDTHRWMTPPPDLLAFENKGKAIDQWVFPKPLQQWVQRSGIDLAVQTDGRSLTVLGFDLRAGNSFPADDHREESAIAQAVERASAEPSPWITLKLQIVKDTLFRRTPFVTREGGLGTFRFHVSGVLGPNTIHLDTQLARGPDVPKLTGQPVLTVYEPPILAQLASPLLVDVADGELRLKIPQGPSQIDLSADQVTVGERSIPQLRAARLQAGSFKIDAAAGQIGVRGRKGATLRRVGDRVQIEFEKRVPGRYQRNPDKRVAQAERLTLSMPDQTVSQEEALVWETGKPSPEVLQKQADERRKRNAAGEALYADLADKHGFSLAPGQFMKRIPRPFPEARDEYWRVTRPDQFFYLSPMGGRGPEVVSYRWDGKTLHEGPDGYGTVWSLINVAHVLHKLRPQQMSGSKSLLVTPLPGDWVYREGITDEIFVAQLEPILRKEMKLPIHLEFREVPREVYVARGTWHLTPLADTRVRSGGVQIYGKELNFGPIRGGGGHGGLTEFLDAVGEWIDARVIRDNVANPPQRLTWQYHLAPHTVGMETTEDKRRAARDPALVLHNLEVQTGLKFTKETRPVRMLFVEEKPL